MGTVVRSVALQWTPPERQCSLQLVVMALNWLGWSGLFPRYDEGSIMVKVGREEPAVSMDASGGKIIWARHSEVQQANLKAMGEGAEIKDGERLPLAVKDMGSCDIYPQTIAHNPNGRLVSPHLF